MSRTLSLEALLVSLLAGAFLHYAVAFDECTAYSFKCLDGKCISRRDFCDGRDDCRDNSDERYCASSANTKLSNAFDGGVRRTNVTMRVRQPAGRQNPELSSATGNNGSMLH
ncbi:hypothetical protein AVEN_46967-1 [Araneus ventricosus]|uniref:Uncharacterized protein n=1 Tax=Araneus ventricosus TaxID=182803 RepID=A0A4Y2I543_ARAVE|nr:hypothetical protein AVEN_46967-1 [Araneus ventricosus]